MDHRTKSIVKVLTLSFACAFGIAICKLIYGKHSHSLAFAADGLHSIFDSLSTLIGAVSILWSSQPPDEKHPYGHQKFETISAISLAIIVLFTAYEIGTMAVNRLVTNTATSHFSLWGIAIITTSMVINWTVGKMEFRLAKKLGSPFLRSDAAHNYGDFWISAAVLVSVIAAYFQIPYVDALASGAITLYLLFMGFKLMTFNLKPLVDASVLDVKTVHDIVTGVEGVIHCHAIRSRGHEGAQFLDLNIHLPGQITLNRAHEITHTVEERLRNTFPGLVDVVIHTEPHNHPPCSKEG